MPSVDGRSPDPNRDRRRWHRRSRPAGHRRHRRTARPRHHRRCALDRQRLRDRTAGRRERRHPLPRHPDRQTPALRLARNRGRRRPHPDRHRPGVAPAPRVRPTSSSAPAASSASRPSSPPRGIAPILTHEQTAILGLATRINARFADVLAALLRPHRATARRRCHAPRRRHRQPGPRQPRRRRRRRGPRALRLHGRPAARSTSPAAPAAPARSTSGSRRCCPAPRDLPDPPPDRPGGGQRRRRIASEPSRETLARSAARRYRVVEFIGDELADRLRRRRLSSSAGPAPAPSPNSPTSASPPSSFRSRCSGGDEQDAERPRPRRRRRRGPHSPDRTRRRSACGARSSACSPTPSAVARWATRPRPLARPDAAARLADELLRLAQASTLTSGVSPIAASIASATDRRAHQLQIPSAERSAAPRRAPPARSTRVNPSRRASFSRRSSWLTERSSPERPISPIGDRPRIDRPLPEARRDRQRDRQVGRRLGDPQAADDVGVDVLAAERQARPASAGRRPAAASRFASRPLALRRGSPKAVERRQRLDLDQDRPGALHRHRDGRAGGVRRCAPPGTPRTDCAPRAARRRPSRRRRPRRSSRSGS